MRPHPILTPALLLVAGLGASLVSTPLLRAQTGADDTGTFRVLVGGREAGTEEFSIQQAGSGADAEVIATGRVRLSLPTGTLELSPRIRARGLEASPVAYQIEIGGDSPRKIVGTVGGGRFSARIASPSGEQLREYLVSNGAVVLDEGIAHHYYFLAQLGARRVPIIIPRENRQVMATVSDRTEERIEVGGAPATVFRFVVRPDGGEERLVWVDALNRVVRVEIPSRDYVAMRTQLPR